ncbi:DUF5678 domain-containing protein [Streptomyces sp.]|uniref:DUF5678 domain-containing protein n=1 Tax=Streptomyces sp. TaxID=1931 RepID=UPI002F92F7CD
MPLLIKDEYIAVGRDGSLVAHGEDYDQVLAQAVQTVTVNDAEFPASQVLIVKGSLVTKSN